MEDSMENILQKRAKELEAMEESMKVQAVELETKEKELSLRLSDLEKKEKELDLKLFPPLGLENKVSGKVLLVFLLENKVSALWVDSVYGRGLQLDKAIEIFSNARRSGLYLDEKIYTNMIIYYGKDGKMSEALALFSEMQKKGIKPGTPSYNMMIEICATIRLHCEVEELMQAMERNGRCTDSSSSTYLSLVQAYAENSQYAEAEKTITLMKEKGIPLSHSHFSSLLSAFAKAGMMDEAARIYSKMSEAGISPDGACKRTVLKGYKGYGDAEKGILFYE